LLRSALSSAVGAAPGDAPASIRHGCGDTSRKWASITVTATRPCSPCRACAPRPTLVDRCTRPSYAAPGRALLGDWPILTWFASLVGAQKTAGGS